MRHSGRWHKSCLALLSRPCASGAGQQSTSAGPVLACPHRSYCSASLLDPTEDAGAEFQAARRDAILRCRTGVSSIPELPLAFPRASKRLTSPPCAYCAGHSAPWRGRRLRHAAGGGPCCRACLQPRWWWLRSPALPAIACTWPSTLARSGREIPAEAGTARAERSAAAAARSPAFAAGWQARAAPAGAACGRAPPA